MKNRSNTVINWRIFPKIDSYRKNENNSAEKQGISTRKENPDVSHIFTENKIHRGVAIATNCNNAPS